MPDAVCSPQSLWEAGANELLSRSFVDDDPASPPATRVVVTWGEFDTFELARAYEDRQVSSWEACSPTGATLVRLGPAARMWRIDFADRHEYVGFRGADRYALIVQWTSPGVNDDDFSNLNSRANERLSSFVFPPG